MCPWHSSTSSFLLGCQDHQWTLDLASYHPLVKRTGLICHDVFSNSEVGSSWYHQLAFQALNSRWGLGIKGVCWCVCVYMCAWGGEGRGACILKLQQYSSNYYMHMAGVDRLVIHFYLKIHNSPFLVHFRPPNLATTSNWCPAGMTHEVAWLEQSRQSSGWSHPRRFREERWACVMLRPPCLTISRILDSRFILNIRALQCRRSNVHSEWLLNGSIMQLGSSPDSQLRSSYLVQPVQDAHIQDVRFCTSHFVTYIPPWYLAFCHMLLFSCSIFIPLSKDFVDYLNSDGLILPDKWVDLTNAYHPTLVY